VKEADRSLCPCLGPTSPPSPDGRGPRPGLPPRRPPARHGERGRSERDQRSDAVRPGPGRRGPVARQCDGARWPENVVNIPSPAPESPGGGPGPADGRRLPRLDRASDRPRRLDDARRVRHLILPGLALPSAQPPRRTGPPGGLPEAPRRSIRWPRRPRGDDPDATDGSPPSGCCSWHRRRAGWSGANSSGRSRRTGSRSPAADSPPPVSGSHRRWSARRPGGASSSPWSTPRARSTRSTR